LRGLDPHAEEPVRDQEAFADERQPVRLANRSKRIMTAAPIQAPGPIQERFLDQVLAAAQEELSHLMIILNDAPQLPLDAVVAVFFILRKLRNITDQVAGQSAFSSRT
jgi:hypothetical protein